MIIFKVRLSEGYLDPHLFCNPRWSPVPNFGNHRVVSILLKATVVFLFFIWGFHYCSWGPTHKIKQTQLTNSHDVYKHITNRGAKLWINKAKLHRCTLIMLHLLKTSTEENHMPAFWVGGVFLTTRRKDFFLNKKIKTGLCRFVCWLKWIQSADISEFKWVFSHDENV